MFLDAGVCYWILDCVNVLWGVTLFWILGTVLSV